ncbi:MAG: glycosyltransferase family 39 protein [Phototrophicaceae bacterium]
MALKHQLHWAWLVPMLCLFTALVGSHLDEDGFWYDEVFTVRNAGGAAYSEPSLGALYASIQADDPYQAIGYPLVIAAWGALVGWSEFALRVSAFLFAAIAIAISYRLGRDTTHSSATGVLSALIFGFSTFTVHYAHELRAFTFITIFSGLLLWSYARILQKPSPWAYAVFILAGVGLLYAHYYAAMLLIALAAYHLLFVPKNRNWLWIPLCGVLMALTFVPQLPAFLEGFTRFDAGNVEGVAMPPLLVIDSLLYYIGNGLNIITLLLMFIGIFVAYQQQSQLRMVVSIAIFGTAILILSNQALNILEAARLRYAIFLWIPFAVWLAAAILFVSQYLASIIRQKHARIALLMLIPILWFSNAILANLNSDFNASIAGTETPRLRSITQILRADGSQSDLFAFYNGTSSQAWYIQDTLSYSTWNIPMPTITTASLYDINEATRAWASEQIASSQRVWYGANRTFGLNQVHDDFVAMMNATFIVCDTPLMNADLSLVLYARSHVYCNQDDLAGSIQIENFTLVDYIVFSDADTIITQLAWRLDESVQPDSHSVSIQIQDTSGDVVASQDVGIPYDRFVPMQITVDRRDLSAGEYRIFLVLYNWQTGERLSNSEGDMLSLGTITLIQE